MQKFSKGQVIYILYNYLCREKCSDLLDTSGVNMLTVLSASVGSFRLDREVRGQGNKIAKH